MSGFGQESVEGEAAAGTNAVASLQAGHPFSLLLAENDGQRAQELEATLDAVDDGFTRVVVATNPLRARLTLERLLIQVIPGGPEALEGDGPTLVRRIAQRRGDETRVILVVERSETLHPEVMHFFGQVAAYFPDADPRLQVLFVGRPEFRAVLDAPDALMDEHTAQLDGYRPVEPAPAFALPGPADQPMPPSRLPFVDHSLRAQFRAAWAIGMWTRIGIVGGTVVGLAAMTVAVTLALGGNNGPITADPVTTLELPQVAELETDPPVLQPGPPADEATARLRSDFESYLTALGREPANVSQAQRRAWFQEFQVWKARTGQVR